MNHLLGRLAAAIIFAVGGVAMGQTKAVDVARAPDLSGASVSLPFDALKGLLGMRQSAEVQPPVDYVMSPAIVSVVVAGKTATAKSDFDVTLLVGRWTLVPVGTAAGVLKVSVDGVPAAVVQRGGDLFAVLDGKNPKVKVQVVAQHALRVDGPVTTLELPLVPSPLVDLTAILDRANLAFGAPNAAAFSTKENAGKTTLTAHFQGNQIATLVWREKPAAGINAVAKVSAETFTRVAIDRDVIHYSAEIHYDVQGAPVDSFKIALPPGVDFLKATGVQVRDAQVIVAPVGTVRTLNVDLAQEVQDGYVLNVTYDQRFNEKDASPALALLANPPAVVDHGSIGLEVRGGYELTPIVSGAQRVDVKDLSEAIWSSARSPLLFGYRYRSPSEVKISLGLTRNADVNVLIAMSDICEAATTLTPDGKTITKAMYITRNNLKQFMTLKMPEGAQLWSAFVDDCPVTPVTNAHGEVLIPLKKSDAMDPNDQTSYRALREERRADGVDRMRQVEPLRQTSDENQPADLKPYDVEIVYVTPAIKLEDRGQLKLALPQSDIPIGKVSWAIFLPESLRVVDSQGNMDEVGAFSLPFRQFGEVAWEKQRNEAKLADAAQQAQQAQALDKLSEQSAMAAQSEARGVLPVRVDIPISGAINRFEKLLTVNEAPSMTLMYHKRGL